MVYPFMTQTSTFILPYKLHGRVPGCSVCPSLQVGQLRTLRSLPLSFLPSCGIVWQTRASLPPISLSQLEGVLASFCKSVLEGERKEICPTRISHLHSALPSQVCEKTSSPQLVELLLDAGSREQDVRDALAISVAKGDSPVVSLLLRRLALDLANSSICLGGFCLGKLEPAWLGPLFPDKTPCTKSKTRKEGTLPLTSILLVGGSCLDAQEEESGQSLDIVFVVKCLERMLYLNS